MTDPHRPPCQTAGIDAIKRMPREMLQEFMKLLAGYERRELERVMQERLEAERREILH